MDMIKYILYIDIIHLVTKFVSQILYTERNDYIISHARRFFFKGKNLCTERKSFAFPLARKVCFANFARAGVAKPGQRRKIEGLVSKGFLSSNLSPRIFMSERSE